MAACAYTLLVWLTLQCVPVEQRAYDVVSNAYSPYMSNLDPYGLPMKVQALARSPYTFWRGGREMFFLWCQRHAQDWLEDHPALMVCHGDPHIGNIGVYPAGDPLGTLAFGMVDFDDSHRLPFQYELLQGSITLRLIAQQNNVSLTKDEALSLIRMMTRHYVSASASNQPAREMLSSDPRVRELLSRQARYEQILPIWVQDGRFRRVIRSKSGDLREVLRPPVHLRRDIASAIADAVAHSPQFALRFRYRSVEEITSAIQDAALRTRVGSSGSQGLNKYVVLMRRPLADAEHDAIVYLKQQIPSAAERVSFAAADPRVPAERCVSDLRELAAQEPYLSSWGIIGEQSYWVTLKDPWSEELNEQSADDFGTLLQLARIWGISAGASHQKALNRSIISNRVGKPLIAVLEARSDAYLKKLNADFSDFREDWRVRCQIGGAGRIASYLADQGDAAIP